MELVEDISGRGFLFPGKIILPDSRKENGNRDEAKLRRVAEAIEKAREVREE